MHLDQGVSRTKVGKLGPQTIQVMPKRESKGKQLSQIKPFFTSVAYSTNLHEVEHFVSSSSACATLVEE